MQWQVPRVMEGISESFHLRSRIAEDYFQVFKSWKLLIVGLADEADAASFGIVWINLDGFSEIGDCTLHIPFCYFCNSAVVVRHNVLRVGCHRTFYCMGDQFDSNFIKYS